MSQNPGLPLWIQAVPLFLTPLLGLTGVLAGVILTERRERYRWLRAERHRAYGAYLTASESWLRLTSGELRWAMGTGERQVLGSLRLRLIEVTHEILRRREEVMLLGPESMRMALATVPAVIDEALQRTSAVLSDLDADRAALNRTIADFERLHVRARVCASTELLETPRHRRFMWWPRRAIRSR